jgi:hypothetical protein
MFIYWAWLCIKARSFFFFNTSNPSIKNGGFLMESKWDIHNILPKEHRPETLFFQAGSEPEKVIGIIGEINLSYPLIGKPDIGLKGMGVKKLDSEAALIEYIENARFNFLIQEFVSFRNEVGIFYYRYPNEIKGHISGIVSKEFIAVTGDGTSTIKELLMKNKRFILQVPVLRQTYGDGLNRILNKTEELILVPYGNHVRGAKFTDVSHLIDDKLIDSVDRVCSRVNGFYYGRMDIRYNSWEELREGKKFSIIELNGAGSEPTHIYDPRHSIFFAWKEIIRHWNILFRISRLSHVKHKQPYMRTKAGWKMLMENKEHVKVIANNHVKRA